MSNDNNMESKITTLSTELNTLKELLVIGLKKVDSNFEVVKNDIDVIHKKIDNLTKKVENLEGSTTDGFDDVGIKIESLTEEISKIGQVTGYDDQMKNLQGFN